MTATLLPIPDDPRFGLLVEAWTDGSWQAHIGPLRSPWLREFEDVLREFYPQASSRDLSLTARHAAPFPLRDGPNVP